MLSGVFIIRAAIQKDFMYCDSSYRDTIFRVLGGKKRPFSPSVFYFPFFKRGFCVQLCSTLVLHSFTHDANNHDAILYTTSLVE